MKLKQFTALAAALAFFPGAVFAGGPYVPFHNYGGSAPGTLGVAVFPSRVATGPEARIDNALRARYGGSANTMVQVELAELGYYRGPIDGNVTSGTRTATAIASYQRDHRMPVTGAITGGLLASLNAQ